MTNFHYKNIFNSSPVKVLNTQSPKPLPQSPDKIGTPTRFVMFILKLHKPPVCLPQPGEPSLEIKPFGKQLFLE